MNQRQLFILSFFVLFILIFLQLIGVFRPFITPILWASILAIVFYPLYKKVLSLTKERKNISSLLVVLVVLVMTGTPMVFFTGTLVKEVLQFYQVIGQWIGERRYELFWGHLLDSPLRSLWDKFVEKTSMLDIQFVPLIGRYAQSFSQSIVGQIQSGARNFLFFILNYFATLFILFFFLRDGHSLGQGLKDIFPMARDNKDVVFKRLGETTSAVVRGLVFTGAAQGVLAGSAFFVLGVPFPLFLSLLIGFMAFVPIGGAVLIWLPSSVYLLLTGHLEKALILFLWGSVVISTVDNLIKPLVIGDKTKIPTLFLFLAILGGMIFYGFIGVFLGPIMLTLFLTLVEIYRKEYPSEKV
ncbi:MAG: AI-2E family transporter [Deltaproteobacteria bacterium]|nr:AI-2E family transporter [Deltaproteobacteria bacterium]